MVSSREVVAPPYGGGNRFVDRSSWVALTLFGGALLDVECYGWCMRQSCVIVLSLDDADRCRAAGEERIEKTKTQ